MPAAALAIPAIASVAGSYFSAQRAATPSPQEQAGTQGQLGLASGLQGVGLPATQQAAGYFSKLAGGNRATMTQALAPDISNINSVYGGTARTLSRFLRGPEKDVAMAGAEQQRAGQIGNLFSTARPTANAALAGIGSGATGQAGGLFGTAVSQGIASRDLGANITSQAGQGAGGLFMQLLQAYQKGKGTGFGGVAPGMMPGNTGQPLEDF